MNPQNPIQQPPASPQVGTAPAMPDANALMSMRTGVPVSQLQQSQPQAQPGAAPGAPSGSLPDDKRQQLDNIVLQMHNNKEPDANIQAVVNDFKTKYTGGAQAQQPGQEKSVGGFLGNIVKSGLGVVGGVANALVHPIDTVSNIAGTAAGGIEKLAGANNADTQKFDNMVNFFKNRYGGLSNIGETLYNDPVGALLDASTLFTGGAAAVGKLGTLAKIGEVGEAANTASKFADVAKAAETGNATADAGMFSQSTGALSRIAGKAATGIKNAVLPELSNDTRTFLKTASPSDLQEVQKMAQQPSVPINGVVSKIDNARKIIEKNAGDDYLALKGQAPATPFAFDTKQVFADTKNMIQSEGQTKILKDGSLDPNLGKFGRDERRVLEDSLDTIKKAKVATPDDISALKSRLRDNAKSITPGPGEKASNAYRIFNKMVDGLDKYLPESHQAANEAYSAGMKLSENIQKNLVRRVGDGEVSPSSLSKVKRVGNEEVAGVNRNMLNQIKSETAKDFQKSVNEFVKEHGNLFQGEAEARAYAEKQLTRTLGYDKNGLDVEKELKKINAAKELNPNLVERPTTRSGLFERLQQGLKPAFGQATLEAQKSGLLDRLSGIGKRATTIGKGAATTAKRAYNAVDAIPKNAQAEILLRGGNNNQ